MPFLFSLGIHDALTEVQQHLEPGEWLFAYLDDVYVLSSPERTRELYNMLEEVVGCHPQRARPAMCVAGPAPVRWTPLPPFAAHSSSFSVWPVRARARRGDATHHGGVVGENPWR